jgi:hypothetical protein
MPLPVDINMRTQLQTIMELMVAAGSNVEGLTDEEVVQQAQVIQSQVPDLQIALQELANLSELQGEAAEEKENIGSNLPFSENIAPLESAMGMDVQSSSKKIVKAFNLKKAQEMMPPMDPMGLNDSPEMVGDELQMQDEFQEEAIQDPATLEEWLNRNNEITANQYFENRVTNDEQMQLAKDNLAQWYQTPTDTPLTPVDKSIILTRLLLALGKDTMTIEAPYRKACVKEIEEVNNIIKKLAYEHVNKKESNGKFNLKKTAQEKSIQNVVMYGPNQMRVDPFYRHGPVSDWHIMERNKGFGQDIGGIWDIDFETLWRTHIMDKYSRPYRDDDGKWVGGYINKRFEVDSNIPETSNYQMKPGQRRRPILPEYGNTESRLQAARSTGKVVGSKGDKEPFNWSKSRAGEKKDSTLNDWNKPIFASSKKKS